MTWGRLETGRKRVETGFEGRKGLEGGKECRVAEAREGGRGSIKNEGLGRNRVEKRKRAYEAFS